MHNSYLDLNNSEGFHILCHAIGLDRAYVLARIHGWVSHNQSKEKREAYADGHYWMFATMEELNIKHFPYLSRSALKRHIYFLEESGLLIADLHNRKKTSRKWYRVNYDAVNTLCENEMVKMTNSESEMVNLTSSPEIEMVNLTNSTSAPLSLGQNEPSSVISLVQNEPKVCNSLVQNEPNTSLCLVQNEPSEQDETDISDDVWSKMNHSLVQNEPTIEKEKNKYYLYSSLFGSFSLLKKNLKDISMVEIDTEPDLTLKEAEQRFKKLRNWLDAPERNDELGDLMMRNIKIIKDAVDLDDYIKKLRVESGLHVAG